MRSRSQSREYALQMLYQMDMTGQLGQAPEPSVEAFWQPLVPSPEVKRFANKLVLGTLEHLAEIDPLISRHADHWEIKRMAVIDRNVLRLGAFELCYLDDVPPKVCLNEAIELAKRFGDAESGKFINGILDAIHKSHQRPAR